MDFLQEQGTLNIFEWTLRAVIAFFFLVITTRILGQRTLSQLRLLDFVIALVIGNIIANPLSDQKVEFKGSIITTVVLVVLYLFSTFATLRFPLLRKLLNNQPITVVQNGKILDKGLRMARISIDLLLEELREEKVDDVKKVALAIWEADGKLSIFLDPKYEPLTPSHYQMKTEPFDLPLIIVKEGRILSKELKSINKDENWVVSSLQKQFQTEVKNVLLATIDKKGSIKIFLYK